MKNIEDAFMQTRAIGYIEREKDKYLQEMQRMLQNQYAAIYQAPPQMLKKIVTPAVRPTNPKILLLEDL